MTLYGFNSRSRKGASMIEMGELMELGVSIHAPVRERPLPFTVFISPWVSIHAPVRERQG